MRDARILKLDQSGAPVEWLDWEAAATSYCLGRVLWTYGDPIRVARGGISALTQRQSTLEIHGVIACQGVEQQTRPAAPPLTNPGLFRRDGNLCMYCGKPFPDSELTRDHIVPLARGGKNKWTNVVAACRRCNNHKGCHLPEECDMRLIAVPYRPNRAEYLAMINSRRILADQMLFLQSRFTKYCRLL